MARYKVTLTAEEKKNPNALISKGSNSTQRFRHALILLNVDESNEGSKTPTKDIIKVLKIGERTIDRVKKKFVKEGFEAVFEKTPIVSNVEKKIDGDVEAHIVALSCSEPPKGYLRWSLRMLSDKMVALNFVDSISHESVRCVLKKRIKTVANKRLDYPAPAKQ